MAINEPLIAELHQEAAMTKRLLERVPMDKADWKPHEKSMSLGRLASHVAELFGWITFTLDTDGIDWATFEYKPELPKTADELVAVLDKNVSGADASLKSADDAKFMEMWTMRAGEQVYFSLPKIAVIRTSAYNHLYHHRGQLTVYLRELGVPLPPIYGPTADEEFS